MSAMFKGGEGDFLFNLPLSMQDQCLIQWWWCVWPMSHIMLMMCECPCQIKLQRQHANKWVMHETLDKYYTNKK